MPFQNKLPLSTFGISNFKSFSKDHWFSLKNITFLIGKNSSGKSSLIQSLTIASNSPIEIHKSNKFGLKESWSNRYTKDKKVLFSTMVDVNCEYLSDRFFVLNEYALNDKSPCFFEDCFFEKILIREGIKEPKYTTKNEYDLEFGNYNVIPQHYYDSKLNKFLSEEEMEELFQEMKALLVKRGESVTNLINYKIKSSEERNRWLNEKNRLLDSKLLNKNLKTNHPSDDPYHYGYHQLFHNEIILCGKFYARIIDVLIHNYDIEIEANTDEEFQTFLTQLLEEEDFKNLKLKSIIKNIELIELDDFKNLFYSINQYDSIFPNEEESLRKFQEIQDKIEKFQLKLYFSCTIHPLYKAFVQHNNCEADLIGKKDFVEDFSVIHNLDSENVQNLHKINFINKYLKEFNIGDKLDTSSYEINGKDVHYQPSIVKGNEKLNYYHNNGYGIQLLVPLILSLVSSKKPLLLIEEPESNLHPALQSKLADFFIEASQLFNKQLVIETHSEYLIRRMQYLIANTNFGKNEMLPKIKSENANIYYFNDPSTLENQSEYTYEINFKNDGGLTKPFASGFFDVTDDIAYELFMLKNKNLN